MPPRADGANVMADPADSPSPSLLTADEAAPRFEYQPALDGVRAIAVICVMLLHGTDVAFPFRFPPGWLGVDVFFALSGYLITSLLLTEWKTFGRVRLRAFYARRFLRLAPLAIAVVASVWIVARVAPVKSHLLLSNRGALSILLYGSNFYYQNDITALGSLLHFWSLSIEEQFYFVWPGLLILLLWIGRKHWRTVAIVFATGVVLTQWFVRHELWVRDVSHHRALLATIVSWYADSFRRPDALVLGCLLALVLFDRRPGKRAIRLIGLWALVGVVAAAIVMRKATTVTLAYTTGYFIPNWGLSLFNVSTIGILAWLVVQPRSLPARVLSTRPMVWIGRRAYGIYLLNALPILFLNAHSAWPWPIRTVLFFGFAFGGAAISYRWFEQPFLRRKTHFSPLGDSGRQADEPIAPTAAIPAPVLEG